MDTVGTPGPWWRHSESRWNGMSPINVGQGLQFYNCLQTSSGLGPSTSSGWVPRIPWPGIPDWPEDTSGWPIPVNLKTNGETCWRSNFARLKRTRHSSREMVKYSRTWHWSLMASDGKLKPIRKTRRRFDQIDSTFDPIFVFFLNINSNKFQRFNAF